jgi:hypothetical protein
MGKCGGSYISSVRANESLSTRAGLSECLSVDSAVLFDPCDQDGSEAAVRF